MSHEDQIDPSESINQPSLDTLVGKIESERNITTKYNFHEREHVTNITQITHASNIYTNNLSSTISISVSPLQFTVLNNL